MVVLTTSKEEEDVLRAYDLAANCYITKPVEFDAVHEGDPDDRGLLADHRGPAPRVRTNGRPSTSGSC